MFKRYSLLVLVLIFIGKVEKRDMELNMQLLQVDFGKRKGHPLSLSPPLSLLAFILHIN